VRELRWGLPTVSREIQKWRALAAAIPDQPLRDDALHALDSKRGHTDGAALFWTLPAHRDIALLRLLVAYEIIYDYLDNVSERSAAQDEQNDRQLFKALVDALDPDRTPSDYYRYQPWRNDGGYLRMLVDACRAGCRELPTFAVVRPFIVREAAHVPVLAINHQSVAAQRDAALKEWATDASHHEHDLRWYEYTAAASQSVVTFVLLALAADPRATHQLAAATYDAYFPWFAYAVTMLDSYVDQREDELAEAHSYISHYPTPELGISRLCESTEQSARRLLALPHGERHAVILGCMIAMYLSKDSVRTPAMRPTTGRIAQAGGSLTRILLPVLRCWRIRNGQASAT
jgi:tetraprenyl-beta-curcumene synthase